MYDADGDETGSFAELSLSSSGTFRFFLIRFEGKYFTETDGFGAIGTYDSSIEDTSVTALTLTGSITKGNPIIKINQLDNTSEDVFMIKI